jgi:hypothetical protein
VSLRGRTAVVGVGSSEYFRRGDSELKTDLELTGEAIPAALADAGLATRDVDGFAYFGSGYDTALLARSLVPEIRWSVIAPGAAR